MGKVGTSSINLIGIQTISSQENLLLRHGTIDNFYPVPRRVIREESEKAMKKMNRDKWIDVEEIYEITTSWAQSYGLYRRNNQYYMTECGGTEYIVEFGNIGSFTEDEAIEEFKKDMADLEKSEKECAEMMMEE